MKIAAFSVVLFVANSISLGSIFCNAFSPTSVTWRMAGIAKNQHLEKNTACFFANHDEDQHEKHNILAQIGKGVASAALALSLSFNAMGPIQTVEPAFASDGKSIALCLLNKCKLPLAKCITNPNCLANVVCINLCNGKDDETGCQIKCGDKFDNPVIGEFNKCAVSDMECVPRRADDGSYPIPSDDKMVKSLDTKIWNGKWFITAGQNELFDIFPCQVHFFTETAPGKFYGKLNWRIIEPDGEYFTRDAIQAFVQDPQNPAHLINHDNEYLHYQDDWYVIDYEYDNNKDGVPPFVFVYYRGSNDAWDGYGGAVVYTRDSKLPPELIPRLKIAAQKANNWDWDKDFTLTDNTCTEITEGDRVMMREKFAGKVALQTEKQLQAAAVKVRNNASNNVKAQKLFIEDELGQAEKAAETLATKSIEFEKEIVKDVVKVEKEIVDDISKVEKEIVKDVEEVEKEVIGIFQRK
jgi:violaxanthin de-epoxidase